LSATPSDTSARILNPQFWLEEDLNVWLSQDAVVREIRVTDLS